MGSFLPAIMKAAGRGRAVVRLGAGQQTLWTQP